MEIKAAVTGMDEVLEVLAEKNHVSVMVNALNKTCTAAKKEIIREIQQRYNITRQKDLDFSTTRATKNTMMATIGIPNKRLPLSLFKPQQQAKGASVEVVRGQRKVITHSFANTMNSGHFGIFVRAKGSTYSGLVPRLPIHELFTLSPAGMYKYRQISDQIADYISGTLQQNL